MSKTIYAWCFSHGCLHTFPAGSDPWCTANWVAFSVCSKAEALEAKSAAYGDAVFFEDLTGRQKLEVLEICSTWG